MTDHVATVTAIGIERSRRAHPSSQPSPAPMTMTGRQLVATFVQRWADGAVMEPRDVRRAIELLMGEEGA